MKSRLPHLSRGLLFVGGLTLLAGPAVAAVEPIVSPAKRVSTLEQARALLAPQTPPARQANPFFTEAFAAVMRGDNGEAETVAPEAPRPEPVGPRSNRDLLQAIALSLKPSGSFVFGGVTQLSFGQKRVKPGGLLTVTFEGKEYTLEVVSIDRTHFTLRLNREEFTRPIK